MNIPNIRLLNQQLLNPLFREPKELVSWMGAMQAQNYSIVKWAVGMRLKSATIQAVEKALHEGEILRTHVMRPTWHLVAAEDIRWMLKLTAQRIISAIDSFAKGYDLDGVISVAILRQFCRISFGGRGCRFRMQNRLFI